jgi:hypothetical protein
MVSLPTFGADARQPDLEAQAALISTRSGPPGDYAMPQVSSSATAFAGFSLIR